MVWGIYEYKQGEAYMNNEELLGALARGYCTKRNSQKVLDPDLIQDMAKEVERLAKPLEPIDKNKLLDMLEGYELNIERCKTNSERRRYRLELAQRIAKFGIKKEG